MPIYAQSSTLRNLTIPLVDVDQTTLADNQVLQYNSTTGKFENTTLTSGGNPLLATASNVGGGEEVFKEKDNTNLIFRTLTSGAGIVLTENADTISIEATVAGSTATNIGSGTGLFESKVGEEFRFRTISAGVGNQHLLITLSGSGEELEFTNTAEINTASNIGGGEGVFESKVAENLQFKSLVAGANVSVTSNASEITISSNAVSGTAYSYQFGVTFDGNGDIDTIEDIPATWTITHVGNIVTITHNLGTYPKAISYWGKDSVNGWQYRMPTAGYQATMDTGQETIAFKIDINATTTGADASSQAKVNVIF